MHRVPLVFTRRSALLLGLVAAGTIALPGVAAKIQLTAPAHVERTKGARPEIEPDRYLFTCESSLAPIGPFTRLEAVWSSPGYMTIESVTATYVGAELFSLTDEEQAIVAVAENAGMTVKDERPLYLSILAACARIANRNMETRLSQLGAPVVEAALALQPDAPQAKQFAMWLAQNS